MENMNNIENKSIVVARELSKYTDLMNLRLLHLILSI